MRSVQELRGMHQPQHTHLRYFFFNIICIFTPSAYRSEKILTTFDRQRFNLEISR